MDRKEPQIIREPIGSATKKNATDAQFAQRAGPVVMAVIERADRYLSQAFRGITAGGAIPPGLFPLERTGVSLQPVVDAARAFTASLDHGKRAAATFDIESKHWRGWHNMHLNLFRHGICLVDLEAPKREAALALVRATLSAAGFENARNVMKLNEHVAELSGRREEYGEWYYFMSLFGEPSETEPWGWQLDGHHLCINCFVLGDQLVVTPHFSGSEPIVALSGKYAGTRLFDAETAAGLDLMRALSPSQQQRAVIGTSLPRELIAIAPFDNLELGYAGIPATDLDDHQRGLLLALVAVYAGRIRPGHAEIRMDEVRAHLDETYVGWIGGWDATSPFYYRVHSPVIIIEFDHLPGIVFDNPDHTRAHVHTIVRTPNGNDYGHDLLHQHYARHDHSHPSTPHRKGEI